MYIIIYSVGTIILEMITFNNKFSPKTRLNICVKFVYMCKVYKNF